MDSPILISLLISLLLTLLGVFAGYWFKKTNNKLEEIEVDVVELDKKDIRGYKNYKALKEANQKAELVLKEKMAELAVDMGKFANTMADVKNILNRHSYEIDNIKEQNKFIATELRELRKQAS